MSGSQNQNDDSVRGRSSPYLLRSTRNAEPSSSENPNNEERQTRDTGENKAEYLTQVLKEIEVKRVAPDETDGVGQSGGEFADERGGESSTGKKKRSVDENLFFGDSETAGNSFQINDHSIPRDITILARCGRSPPLTLFAPATIERIRAGIGIKYTKIATGPYENTRVLDISEFPPEETLSIFDWITCYQTFLDFLSKHASEKVLTGWASHYNAIIKDKFFSQWYPAYRAFDHEDSTLKRCYGSKTRRGHADHLLRLHLDIIRIFHNLQQRVAPVPFVTHLLASTSASAAGDTTGISRRNAQPQALPVPNAPSSSKRATVRSCAAQTADLCACASTSEDPARAPDRAIHFMSAHYATTSTTERGRALAIECQRVVTPYSASGWEQALNRTGLSSKYPTLVHDLVYGAPIGNPPPLSHTFLPPNMPNALEHPSFIEDHIKEELDARRFSGPFSLTDAFLFFGGHFRTAPLGVVEKEPGSGKWRMIRNLSTTDAYGESTNSWLDAKDMVIMWHTVAYFADLTCPVHDEHCPADPG
ncbi:hypothetical protein EWM64_g6870 [Hericium alpestre]|uniref:Uncharacterized protein n=1 Tax=Hericium alpestre TaxID=135208 RepID=A0A4Y9ZS93_9AGAM|nr:hypothetical protein EWM64_g6870 [Hericium alpestre]